MKKLAIIFLLFTLLSPAFGQTGEQTFDLSAGAMFPLKDLSDSNLADSSSGASAVGYHIQVSYSYQFSDFFGVGVDVEFNDAKYSMSKVADYYRQLLDDAQHEISSPLGWSIGGIYFRYYIQIPLSSSIFTEVSPLIGGMGTYSPEYTINSTSFIPPGPNPTYTYYRQRGKAFSFAYGLEAKFILKTNHHGVFLSVRALRSKPTFDNISGVGYDGKPYLQKITMDIMYLTASAGYSYYF
ncbi:outer membrane beta-barrel protein [Candidatus Sulfidibacterium hydrothermale]|uniref:outer membrane beta-barrel protein n=1 Tax=Candidatus Sulfidibacterium hydrothermale TaxID=2875962 RepID=UPI001F0B3CCA|nr:outer membrane beta-barrel protein [Candidatus Sulfidibacterium hydrothermale]UBM61499.1 outer membrane beta-barrel protein [Candidatus Sulfidibacterium hydrothermale]